MSELMRFENLNVSVSSGTLVNDFSLSVQQGEVVALIGESGAGKSTIGLAALGYARAGCRLASGRIMFRGSDLARIGQRGARLVRGAKVAYIAQSAATAFNPAIRIVDQIMEATAVHGKGNRRVAYGRALELARSMGLGAADEMMRRFPHELSGGQLQRLMTVMALMCRPELLVLDEPTTAIDVTTQLGVLASLKRIIQQEKVACLYISHDLAVVAQMADRIVVLRHGGKVEEGEARQLLTSPQCDYTRELIAAASAGLSNRTAEAPVASSEPDVPDAPGAPVLEIRHAVARYGRGKPTLNDVSLTVRRGEFVAIVGESGSGKSTLARVATGLLPIASGELLLNGRPLAPSLRRRGMEELRGVQLVLQHPDLALNPRITVGAAIGRPLERYFGLKGAAREKRVAELLRLVELPEEVAQRLPSQLSGGQKQRANLARALAAEPDLLVCDEVTAALDSIVSSRILALLSTLRRQLGTACIFITHDVSKASKLADQIYVMHQGQVVESGQSPEVVAHPQHPYTQALFNSIPELRTDWLKERMPGLAA